MSTTIDQQVVEMRFDNQHFEKNVQTSMSTLDKLKQKLNFKGASKGLDEINTSTKRIDMSSLGRSIETVGVKFNGMYTIADQALRNITTRVQQTAEHMVKALTIDPVKTGLSEYETKMNAIQVIQANTRGKNTMEDITAALEELNTYADKTIYNFAQMTSNIGKFTAQGLDVQEATNAVKGLANVAAASGASAEDMARATYQMSQALGGTIKLMDWNSLRNANMATVELKNTLIDLAKVHGIAIDDMIKKEGTFEATLSKGWLTGDIFTEAMNIYSGIYTDAELKAKGFTDAQVKNFKELAAMAESAATEVKTFTQLWDVLKETAQSGWTHTWELIIGDFESAKDMLTKLQVVFSNVINKISDTRNEILRGALTSKWDQLTSKIEVAGFTTKQFEERLTSVLEASGISTEKLIDKYDSLGNAIKKGKIHASYIIKALKNLIGVEDETSKATEKVTMSVEELEKVAKRVISGEFGNGEERLKALTEAGYDYATVQNKVNELLGSSVRHNAKLTEAQLANADSLVKLTDEQLKAKGYTDEQIEALRELEKVANDTDSTISKLIEDIQKPDGRTLLIDSFKNMWSEIKNIFHLIGEAWTNVFGEKDTYDRSQSIYNLIEKFHDLTESMKMSEETANNFRRILEGVFSALDLSWSLASVSLMGGLKILNEVFKLFGTNLGEALAFVADQITKLNEWVEVETIFGSETKWADLAKIIVAIGDGIKSCVDALMSLDVMSGVVERVKKLFSDLFDGFEDNPFKFFTTDNLVKVINDFFEKIKNWITAGGEAENLGLYIIEGLIKGIINTAKKLADIAIEVAKTFIDAFCTFFGIASPSKLMITLGGFIIAGLILGLTSHDGELGQVISGLGGKLLDAFKQLTSLLMGGIEKIDFGKILAVGLSAGLITVLKNLSDVLALFGAPFEAFGKLMGGLGSMFKSIGDGYEALLKSEAFKNRGKAILSIALAIGVLVAAVVVIAKLEVETKDLWKAVGVVSVLALVIGGITAALMLLEKSTGEMTAEVNKKGFAKASLSISTAAFTILAIGASLALMAFAIKQISEIDCGGVAQSIGIFALMIGGLFVILHEVNKIASVGGDVNFKGIGKIFTKLALSMLLMVGVIKLASMLKAGEIIEGAVVMGLVGLFYTAIVKSIRGIDAKSVEQVGKLTRRISTSLLLMIGVIKIASMLSLGEVVKGSAVILGIAGFFAAFIYLTKYINTEAGAADSISSVGKTLIKMSAAMLLMTFVIKMVAGMSWEDIAKGISVIYAMGGLFAAITYISKFSGEHAAKAGLMMLEMSAAMLIMTAILILLKDLDSEGIGKALGIMTAFTAMFGALIGISYFAKHADKVKGTIIALTVAIGVLVIALVALTFLDEDKVKTAAGALTAVIGVFALLMHASSYLKSGKKTWVRNLATIIALTAVVAALAGTIASLAQLEPERAVGAAKALSILLLSLSSSLFMMSKAKSFSKKNLANMLITLSVLSIIAAGLGYVIKSIGSIDPESAVGASTGIGILLLALSTSLNIVSRSKSISDKKLPGILATLGMLTTVALACTLMIYALSKCNPANSVGNAVALGVLLTAISASLNIVAMSKSINSTKLPGIIATLGMLTVVGLAGTLMIYALSKCDPSNSIGNAVALGILLAAISASLNIVSRSKSISPNKLPGIIASLATLTVVTGLLAVILGTLSHFNAEPSISSAVALSILLTTLSVAMIPLTLIGKQASSAIKGAVALTSMAIPLAAFAFVLSKMPDLSTAQGNVVLLVNLMTAMTLLLIPLSVIGYFVGSALGGVLALTAMVVPLAAFAFALSKMPDMAHLEATVMVLIKLMTAMTLLLIPLTVIGHFAVGALLGAVALTAMVIPLAAFAFALNKLPDLSGSIKSIETLGEFMDKMANVLIKVTLASPFVGSAITAILLLSGVILAFGVVATAIGALMKKFPSLEEFLNKGMDVLAGIAEGIGKILGKFITGFTNEIMTILPNLGIALSSFMMHATPFLVGIKMVDESVVTGVKNLSKAILLLTATELITSLVTFGGLDLVMLGNNLRGFAESILPFIDTMKQIDPASVESAQTLAKLVLALAGADFLSAITDIASKVLGLDEMDSFSTKLKSFATAMADFSATLKEKGTDIDPQAIEQAASAGMAMVKLANAIPKSEGFLQDIVGEKDLGRFGTMCAAFGRAIKDMSNALTGENGAVLINEAAIDAAVKAGQSMNKLAKAIPKSEGFLQDIVGESDLARFGIMCSAFGVAIKTMSSVLTGENGAVLINDAAIESAVKAGNGMSEIANAIPKKDGFLQDIVGEQDLQTFGSTCKAFGEAIKEMSNALTADGESVINDAAIESAKQAGLMMAEVQKAIPADKWLDGKISIDDFGTKIKSFGSSLVEYGKTVSEMDVTQVTNSITQAKRLANLAKSVVDLDTSGITKFADVTQIADTIKSYSDKIGELDSGVLSTSISSAARLRNFINSLVDLDNSGVEKFKLGSIGDAMRSYINSVADMDTSTIHSSISAATRLKNFIRGLVDLDASGIVNFKPAQIGDAIRAYSNNVAGIDPEAVSSSISAANRLKNFISSLAGLDVSGVDSFSSAASKLGQVNVDGFVKAFSGSAGKLTSAGTNMMDSLIKGIRSRQGALTTAANTMVNTMVTAIKSKLSTFRTAGTQIMVGFIQGMNSKRSAVKNALTTSLSSAVSSARGKYRSFYNAGSYLVDGFAAGISANTFKAEAKAAAMASAALEAAKAALDINSPSKVFREIGKSVPEGFAQGIDMLGNLVKDSSVGMTDVALDGVSNAISTIADAINADIDSQPVIRPVLDLSDITSGAGTINSMFGMTPSVGVIANVGSISSMMNGNQNGTNADIISAINKLRSDLGGVRGDTYQLGNITYDDGSNISEAVKTLVRAAKVERRI